MAGEGGDAQLLQALACGDAAAFSLLVQRHAPRVLAFARAVLGNPTEAEDVTQDVFIKLWQRPQTYDPRRGAFTTWLFQVTRNAALNHRERVRGRETPWDEDAAEPVDESPGPEEFCGLIEDAARFTAAVGALPEAQRSALALVYSQGLSGREAAAALGVSAKALESLLVRAKRSLRAALAAPAPEWDPDRLARGDRR